VRPLFDEPIFFPRSIRGKGEYRSANHHGIDSLSAAAVAKAGTLAGAIAFLPPPWR
jgi:hypothetical protein